MTLDDIPLFATLKSRLDYIADRQKLIAQNVANSDTPGYGAQDLKPFTLPGQAGGTLAMTPVAPAGSTQTSAMFIPLAGTGPGAAKTKPTNTPDSETTLNGNSVVLEEEMMKMNQSRMEYDAAVGFYQKSMSLLQMAMKRPGQ
ncbi:MAG: flagellar biosynthesis protein FlgB [Caulobacterales bacterium]